MPPASTGHDYIGTAANQVYIRLGQPAISRSNRRLRHVPRAQSNSRRRRRVRVAPVARAAPKTRTRLQRQQLARMPTPIAATFASSSTRRPAAWSKPSHSFATSSSVCRTNRYRRPSCKKPRRAWSATRCSTKRRRAVRPSSCSTSRPTISRSTTTGRSTSASRGSRPPTFSASRARICDPDRLVEVYAGPCGPWAYAHDMIVHDRSRPPAT